RATRRSPTRTIRRALKPAVDWPGSARGGNSRLENRLRSRGRHFWGEISGARSGRRSRLSHLDTTTEIAGALFRALLPRTVVLFLLSIARSGLSFAIHRTCH